MMNHRKELFDDLFYMIGSVDSQIIRDALLRKGEQLKKDVETLEAVAIDLMKTAQETIKQIKKIEEMENKNESNI